MPLPNHLQEGMVSFHVGHAGCKNQRIPVDAVILSKVTADLPVQPVRPNKRWKHISKLQLADPDFGTPGRIDLLLGADVFSKAMRHGRRLGPSGAPAAFNTTFGWVLTGEARSTGVTTKAIAYCASVRKENATSLGKSRSLALKRFPLVQETSYWRYQTHFIHVDY